MSDELETLKPDPKHDFVYEQLTSLITQNETHGIEPSWVDQKQGIHVVNGKEVPIPRSLAQRGGSVSIHVLGGQRNIENVLAAIEKSPNTHTGVIYTTGTLDRLGLDVPRDKDGNAKEPDGEIFVPFRVKDEEQDREPEPTKEGDKSRVMFMRQPFYLAENVPDSPEFDKAQSPLLAPETSKEKFAQLNAAIEQAAYGVLRESGVPYDPDNAVSINPAGNSAHITHSYARSAGAPRGQRDLTNVSITLPSVERYSVIPPSVKETGVDLGVSAHGMVDVAAATKTALHELMHVAVKGQLHREAQHWDEMDKTQRAESLTRALGRTYPNQLSKLGDKAYAREEMSVEASANALMHSKGLLPHTLENSAAYVHGHGLGAGLRGEDIGEQLQAQRNWFDTLTNEVARVPEVEQLLALTREIVPQQDMTQYLERVHAVSERTKSKTVAQELGASVDAVAKLRKSAQDKGLGDPRMFALTDATSLKTAYIKQSDKYVGMTSDPAEAVKGRLAGVVRDGDNLLLAQLSGKGRLVVMKTAHTPEKEQAFTEALKAGKKIQLEAHNPTPGLGMAQDIRAAVGREPRPRDHRLDLRIMDLEKGPAHTLVRSNELTNANMEAARDLNKAHATRGAPAPLEIGQTVTGVVVGHARQGQDLLIFAKAPDAERLTLLSQPADASLEKALSGYARTQAPITLTQTENRVMAQDPELSQYKTRGPAKQAQAPQIGGAVTAQEREAAVVAARNQGLSKPELVDAEPNQRFTGKVTYVDRGANGQIKGYAQLIGQGKTVYIKPKDGEKLEIKVPELKPGMKITTQTRDGIPLAGPAERKRENAISR
jgi:hypothetical protein